MKKGIILLLLCATAMGIQAQTQRRDTVVLSVYNNNQRFMLYPMPFGKDKPDIDFTAKMVVSLDTVHVLEVSTRKDSTGKYPRRIVTKRQCGKLPDSLTGKVALLYMSTGCDVSTQVLNAQKMGAIVAIVIHTTDSKDSVELPKQSNTIRYADDNKVRIPCFTVRKSIGAKLATMLPSLVGIQRPLANVGGIQASVVQNNPNRPATTAAQKDSLTQAQQANPNADAKSPPTGDLGGWYLSPNPARDEAVLQYNFTKAATVHIEVFNELGQVLTSYELPDTQTGTMKLDVSAWHNGYYNVSLRNGVVKEVKKLVVAH
jgi:hypothetical protein